GRSGSRTRSASAAAGRRRTSWRYRRRSGVGGCRSWRSCWLPLGLGGRSSVGGRRARVQRGGNPVEKRIGDRPLGLERQVVARAIGGEDRDAVGLGAEPGAWLGDVVGD